MSSAPGASVVRVRFAVLGPLRVWRGDEELDLGPPQQRLILAVLLVRGGQPVSVGELVGALWGADPPNSAVNVLHRHVGLLRRLLEPALPPRATGRWLIRDGNGYRLQVDADSADVLRFRSLAAQAREAAANGQDTAAVGLFVQALGRWMGLCAAGLRPSEWAEPIFVAVDREHIAAVVHAADAALRAGLVNEILPIARLVALNAPLDEELIARLMLMLAASGHQAEALAAYQEVTKRLADELGIGPGP